MNDFENQNVNGQPPVEPVAPQPAPQPAPQVTYQQPSAPQGQPVNYQQPAAPQGQPVYYQQQAAPQGQPVYYQQPVNYQQPVQEEPKKKKKGGKAVLVILLILLLAGIAVGGYFLIKSLLNAPANNGRILQAYANTTKAILPSGMKNLDREFSADLSLDLSKMPLDSLISLSGTVNGTVNFKNRKVSANLKANVLGMTMDALSVFLSENDVSLKSAMLIGDSAYGLSLKDAEQNIAKSVLHPDSGSELALPKETYDQIVAIIPAVRELLTIDVRKFSSAFETELWNEIDALNVTEKSEATITVLEKEYDVNVTKITLNGAQLAELLEKLEAWLEKDSEGEKVFKLLDQLMGIQDVTDREGYLSKFRELLDDMKETGENFTLTVTGSIDKSTGYLARLECTYKMEKDEAKGIEGRTGSYRTDTRIENDFVKTYAALDEGYGFVQEFSTDWNKTSGEFVCRSSDQEEPVMTATITAENDSVTIIPGKVILPSFNLPSDPDLSLGNLNEVDLSFITLKISAKAEEPSVPEYKELLTMSQDDLQSLLETIMSRLRQFGLGSVNY